MRLVDIEPAIKIMEEDIDKLPANTELEDAYKAGCRATLMIIKMLPEVKP